MDADLTIVGAGLVGSALALALGRTGLTVALVEPAPPAPAADGWDSRIYALSPGSRDLLASLGVWDALDRARIEPVTGMCVQGDRPRGQIVFDALDSGVAALAYIVEGGAVARSLWHLLQNATHVMLHVGQRPTALSIDAEATTLTLDGGGTIRAPLIVGADGATSWVRRAAGISDRSHSYSQRGVVANFRAEHDHGGVARQWFRADGVLALLPLPGRHVSMVWSAAESVADELLAMDREALEVRVAQAAGGVCGALERVTPAVGFPLQARVAARFVGPRLALVGDAAHNLHPLAGQGVNLGFRDVRVLAATLTARGPERDIGVLPLLRRYERARREDVAAMLAATDGLHRLFSSRLPGVAALRNSGLNVAGRLPLIKSLLAQHALA
ncbi:MAG: UbiH/UbiF family hydroxylase [Betaproteobacteria bacterium]